MWRRSFSLWLLVALVGGCASLADYRRMEQKASQAGFAKHYLRAGHFTLIAFLRRSASSETLTVYIEGDGRAWNSRRDPSDDPTPHNPVAFNLASQDPSSVVVYLARPGQFNDTNAPNVDPVYWTSRRYSEEVVNSLDAAISQLKELTGTSEVILTGFSGGGALAVLVAQRREDVAGLRTVAGNLALDEFVRHHQVSPLKGSLDPLTAAKSVVTIPQRHFVGQKDEVIPQSIVRRFLDAQGDTSHERLTLVSGAGHSKGWTPSWRKLLNLPLR